MGYITRRRRRLQRQLLAQTKEQELQDQQQGLVLAGKGLKFGSIIPKPVPPPTDSALKLIRKEGLDIRNISGTGKGGRVIKTDVYRYINEHYPKGKAADQKTVIKGEEE